MKRKLNKIIKLPSINEIFGDIMQNKEIKTENKKKNEIKEILYSIENENKHEEFTCPICYSLIKTKNRFCGECKKKKKKKFILGFK